MRRLVGWGMRMALLVGVMGGAARAADETPTAKETPPAPWHGGGLRNQFNRWFHAGENPVENKPSTPPPTEPAKKPAPAAKPVRGEQAAAERVRAEAAWLRRMAVCDKIKQIAFETGDQELQRMADQLDERAQAAYHQRIAQLSSGDARFDLATEATGDKNLTSSPEMKKGNSQATARRAKP